MRQMAVTGENMRRLLPRKQGQPPVWQVLTLDWDPYSSARLLCHPPSCPLYFISQAPQVWRQLSSPHHAHLDAMLCCVHGSGHTPLYFYPHAT